MKATTKSPAIEPAHVPHHHLLCWKSVSAGVLISVMSYFLLSALGAGVLGSAAESAISNESGGGTLATVAALWLGISIVISLFMGSYFAVRISKYLTNKIGAAHGFVVASIFFVLMVVTAMSGIGKLSSGVARIAEGMAMGTGALISTPAVQDTLNASFNKVNLKSAPSDVAQGLAVRLVQGDVESAKAYYAYETGLPKAQVDARVNQLQTQFTAAMKTAGEKASAAVADTGWAMFVVFFVGLLGALFGGRTGAHANADRPLTAEDAATAPFTFGRTILATEGGSALPYFVGWLFGVPLSLLLLIAALRAVF